MKLQSVTPTALAAIAVHLAAAACLWDAWCEFPFHAWNELRLSPAFAWRHGINPYPSAEGGPLSTWMYGPVALALNLPVTFASSAASAMQLAALLNILGVLLPFGIVLFCGDAKTAPASARWFGLGLAILLLPRLNFTFLVADRAAVTFGILSCWALARATHPGRRELAIAAALCALAVWSKQTAIFLVPAHALFLHRTQGAPVAAAYLGWIGLFVGACGLAFGATFGFANLWFNLVTVPGRLPWALLTERLAMSPWHLLAQMGLPLIAIVVLWWRRRWPDNLRASDRFFTVTALSALLMIPIGLAGFMKVGGNSNQLHAWDYFLAGVLVVWLARTYARPLPTWQTASLALLAIALHARTLIALPAKPLLAHYRVGEQLVSFLPGAAWFPQNPLITFFADGRFWHVDDGITTRDLAGYRVTRAQFRAHLPRDLRAVILPSYVERPLVLQLLPEFDEKITYPFWSVHMESRSSNASR